MDIDINEPFKKIYLKLFLVLYNNFYDKISVTNGVFNTVFYLFVAYIFFIKFI